jgi:hypothetical protein
LEVAVVVVVVLSLDEEACSSVAVMEYIVQDWGNDRKNNFVSPKSEKRVESSGLEDYRLWLQNKLVSLTLSMLSYQGATNSPLSPNYM